MQMSYLYASDLPFKNFIYSRYLTSFGSCYCKKQIDVSFLCVSPLIEDKFRHNIVKVFNLDSHALLYANELLVRVRLAFQKLYLFPIFDQLLVLLL